MSVQKHETGRRHIETKREYFQEKREAEKAKAKLQRTFQSPSGKFFGKRSVPAERGEEKPAKPLNAINEA